MNPQNWDRVEELFHRALEQTPEAREVFLHEACGGDAALRKQVELLLSNDVQAGSFLEKPPAEDATVTMAMEVGRQLGPYRVLAPLGIGGMGEVYRAHDSKLGRDVAIKTLPVEFARDSARLARFRYEARVLASLNHPNIAAIYGLEEAGGLECLVLELVEGATLRGPLPIAAALDGAGQVAAALEAAHEKGIVHRDLKPANVKITPEGRVKVLDFGLAKAIHGSSERACDFSQSSTVGGAHTMAGHIIGTPGYMSPEQARGQEVDQRADIWAFGCLLYELLTGKRVFQGNTVQDTIAAVLEREPDWSALSPKAPAKIRELLHRCLEKDAAKRLSSIAEARRAIDQARRGWNRWAVAAGVAALAVAAMGGIVSMRSPAPVSDPSKWVQLTKFPDSVTQPALSPDGKMVAFVHGPSTFFGPGQIYVKILPDGDPVELTHDDTMKLHPEFSPEGTRIAYGTYMGKEFAWDTSVVPVLGGEPQKWLKNATGLIWTAPRHLMFSEIKMGLHMGVVTSDENRAAKREVYTPMTEPRMAHRSYLSPDGKWVLLVEMDDDHLWEPCRVVPADGRDEGHKVGPPEGGCTAGAWTPDGKWMYLTSNAIGANHIWRQRFPEGKPEQVTFGPTEEEGIAMAPDGQSLITAAALQNVSLWIHDPTGERQISVEGNAADPKFTPDGKRLLYRIVREVPSENAFYRDLGEIKVADVAAGRSEALVRGLAALDYDISADGRQVVMQAEDAAGKPQLWLTPLDHSAPPHRIPNVEGTSPRFLPTGEILFRHMEGNSVFGSNGFIYRVRADGTGLQKAIDDPVLMVGTSSPDGSWLGVWAPLRGNGPPAAQLFPLGGGSPVVLGPAVYAGWSPDGRSLVLFSGAGSVIPDGRCYLLPLERGQNLPRVPAGGFRSEEEIAHLPGARRIDISKRIYPGPGMDVYAFYRETIQRNLYRIPIQ